MTKKADIIAFPFERILLKKLALKDVQTYEHSMRVTFYAIELGHAIELPESEITTLKLSALYHDIGKTHIPDNILLKKGKLTQEEFNIMKLHPIKSWETLRSFSGFEQVALNARHHHERFDGSGYPDKLKGEDIPLIARIIAIADTYDAMTSTRPYRNGIKRELVLEELKRCSGSQFDPLLVNHFLELEENLEKVLEENKKKKIA